MTLSQNSANAGVLDLSGKGLSDVSSSIYNKTDTTTLLLSNNSIQTLPSQMGRMTNVSVFRIDHNQLKGSLIGEIRQMSQLRSLDVSYNNNMSGIPDELSQLKDNLKEFNLTGNPLNSAQISNLQAALPNTKIIF